MNEEGFAEREKRKNALAQERYGKPYSTLCSYRKKLIERLIKELEQWPK